MYALERLSSILRRCARMEPDALTERVLADVRAFTGMDSMDDDITLLIMEVIQSF
jgi:serine phosphatase RsbU (regulator of sigma subunit)